MEIVTGEQMRRIDRQAIDGLGIPSLQLMEAAGRGVAEALLHDYPDAARSGVVVICGKGNNGGDGLVASRYLSRRGITPRILLLASAEQLKGDAAHNLRAARKHGLEVRELPDEQAWHQARTVLTKSSVVLDAILGTGVVGGARGLAATVIHDLNRNRGRVAAVDVPSGINADAAEVEGSAVRAERTYTLCRPKLPLVIDPGASHAGVVRVIPIGIPDEVVRAEDSKLEWIDPTTAATLLPPRAAATHKGDYGHLLAVAGSRDKSGAAVLLARGALRCGVGLMTVATTASAQERVAVQQAELMTEPLAETADGTLAPAAVDAALALLSRCDALALGPGLGTGDQTADAVRAIASGSHAPMVIDADGLNALAASGDGFSLPERLRPVVLTPHPGEAARLLACTTRDVQADRLEAARRLARTRRAVVVLKGHQSLVADPDGRVAINSTGNPGMATGGTGDVLTGAVGAFLARSLGGWDAGRLAVFLHGDAGDRAARRGGEDGLIASDLVDELPAAVAGLRRADA
jgi:NAD(P)H-hydrate epimerase